jgi:hypothetical protein
MWGVPHVFSGKGVQDADHGGNDAGNHGLVDVFRRYAAAGEQAGGQDIELVFGDIALSPNPPVMDLLILLKYTNDRVGVADINHQEHG